MTLPALGLGGGPLGNYLRPISEAQAEAVVEAAWEAGIRRFDTAPFYGLGLSERRLGRVLRGLPRTEFVISTKVGRLVRPGPGAPVPFAVPGDRHAEWDFSRDGVLRSVADSLDRLGLDHVDTLLIHDPDQHWPQALDEGFATLAELRAQGVVKAIGVGMNQSKMLVEFVRHADPDVLLAANQVTLLRRSAFEELLPLCLSRGIPVVAASLFHRGDLAAPPPDAPPEVRRYAEACARHGVPLATAAMRFPLRHPAVRSILIGAHTPEQVASNVADFHHPVPEALWHELET
ncbi:aldo/keto reductase [Nonomuraea africana]|uniref:D-threo-aldose 1-dehydrogenase n=1 Tax=Nonomuraea africana TaxID=46171 RepID=A0ABR9KHM5_9ACTN|nr:aldo/keto reductase [Nonomuraea africana]MBE1561511.1 D-threo-aldose 1-dehydrogenase [Nonomuraea africana]